MTDSVLLAVVPVASALVGAGLTWAATANSARTAWRRQHATRWDERRLTAFVDFAGAVKREVYLCLRLGAALDLGTRDVESLSREEGLLLLEEAEDRRSDLFEALLLLADRATIVAARDWQSKVWGMHEMVNGKRKVTQAEFMAAFREAGLARDAYHQAARAALAVSGAFEASVEYSSRTALPRPDVGSPT